MSRSLKKGPFLDSSLVKSLLLSHDRIKSLNKASNLSPSHILPSSRHLPAKKEKFINVSDSFMNVWSRRTCIIPSFIGLNCKVYTGKTFISFKIKEEMVGHKFGEFASTRRKVIHKKKTNKIIPKRKA